jgi:chromatin remodeling complex protein RSC6
MSTEMSNEMPSEKIEVTPGDMLKSILGNMNDQLINLKNLMNAVRVVLKDTERQSKELDKFRNKRNRVKSERSLTALPSGITKPVAISDELAKFLNVAPGTLVPRNEVTKGVSAYVKANNLSDEKNKHRFVLDDRPAAKILRSILNDPKEDVTYFNLQRYLKHHYIHEDSEVQLVKKEVPPVKKSSDVVECPPPTPKKKIMVKKKPTELVEES